jgi:hypothetical protein
LEWLVLEAHLELELAQVEQHKQEAQVEQGVLEVYMKLAQVMALVQLDVPQGLKYQSQPVESSC